MAWNVGELRRGGWLGVVLPEPETPPGGTVLTDVVVSETAPADTTAAWANPTEEA